MKKKLLLVDGNALFHRAFHAFPMELTAPDGRPTNAAFGFTRILMAALRNLNPTHVAVCFDVAGGTFRHEQYQDYKAQRQEMPPELLAQVPMIWELTEKLEVPRFTMEGFEADDLIGTLALQAVSRYPSAEVVILSGDQDLLQLVSERVTVYAPGIGFQKAMYYTPEKVLEKYGFNPPTMVDYKALRGDPSDNIPGVPGIGEVTAKQILNLFGSLDGLYQAIAKSDPILQKLKPAMLQKLQAHEAEARLSYSLATIHTSAPVSFELESCELKLDHPDELVKLFNTLGFKSLVSELPQSHRLISDAASIFGVGEVEPQTTAQEDYLSAKSYQTDLALSPILRQMEQQGILLDQPYLAGLEQKFVQATGDLTEKVFSLSGQSINLDSPAQVAELLYNQLQIPTTFIKKGKTGYSTDSDSLNQLKEKYPIAGLILQYREYQKLLTTYIRPLPALADQNSRVHTNYAPDTATGRISSKNPNLQNIPSRTELGREIRQAFIAPKGRVLLAADYSQIELRLAAHFSHDPVMLEAFQSGRDFHAETAAKIGVDRRTAKVINFSILYGKGAFGFAQDMGISVAEAKAYIDQYFKTFKGLRQYLDELIEQARTVGYLETMDGRRRYFPALQTGNHNQRAAAEREAVNFPIQGSAADLLKAAMIKLAPLLPPESLLILTVHDELVLEVPESEVEATAKLVQTVMTEVIELLVPLEVEIKSGPNWNQLEPIKLKK